MMKHLSALIFSATLMSAFSSKAQAYVEFNGFYYSEAMSNGASQTNSRMFMEGVIGFEIDKKGQYLVGWNYSMINLTDSGTNQTKYSSTQMGPRFLYMIDKMKRWSAALGYYVVTTGSYTPAGGTQETWKGSAIKFDFGYNFPVSEKFSIGLRGNYQLASYNEKLTNETNYEKVSYTNTLMYPSLYAIWLW